jgi:hypothetical protein
LQSDVKVITTLGDLTNALGSIYSGAVDIHQLQNAIQVYSWIGEPTAGYAALQGYKAIRAVMDMLEAKGDISKLLSLITGSAQSTSVRSSK